MPGVEGRWNPDFMVPTALETKEALSVALRHLTLKREVKHTGSHSSHRAKALLKYLAAKVLLLLEAVGSISKLAVCRFLPYLLSKAAVTASGRQANSWFQ